MADYDKYTVEVNRDELIRAIDFVYLATPCEKKEYEYTEYQDEKIYAMRSIKIELYAYKCSAIRLIGKNRSALSFADFGWPSGDKKSVVLDGLWRNDIRILREYLYSIHDTRILLGIHDNTLHITAPDIVEKYEIKSNTVIADMVDDSTDEINAFFKNGVKIPERLKISPNLLGLIAEQEKVLVEGTGNREAVMGGYKWDHDVIKLNFNFAYRDNDSFFATTLIEPSRWKWRKV